MESSQDTPRGQIEFQDTITLRQKKIVNVTADTTTFPYNKIAQINSDELIRRLPEYNLIRDSIVQYQTNLQRQLELMRNYIDQEVSYIIAHKDNLSPAMNYFYQTEVSQLSKLVDLYERIILQEEYTYELALMQPLKEKIKNAVKVVAERNGLIYVFDESLKPASGDPYWSQMQIPQIIYSTTDILPLIETELTNSK